MSVCLGTAHGFPGCLWVRTAGGIYLYYRVYVITFLCPLMIICLLICSMSQVLILKKGLTSPLSNYPECFYNILNIGDTWILGIITADRNLYSMYTMHTIHTIQCTLAGFLASTMYYVACVLYSRGVPYSSKSTLLHSRGELFSIQEEYSSHSQ